MEECTVCDVSDDDEWFTPLDFGDERVKAAALDKVRDLLDAEMAKCQLLCANCHARKTFGYEASTTEF